MRRVGSRIAFELIYNVWKGRIGEECWVVEVEAVALLSRLLLIYLLPL